MSHKGTSKNHRNSQREEKKMKLCKIFFEA